MGAARAALARLTPAERRRKLRDDWARLLGDVDPVPQRMAVGRGTKDVGGALAEQAFLEPEPGIIWVGVHNVNAGFHNLAIVMLEAREDELLSNE